MDHVKAAQWKATSDEADETPFVKGSGLGFIGRHVQIGPEDEDRPSRRARRQASASCGRFGAAVECFLALWLCPAGARVLRFRTHLSSLVS